MGAKAATPLSGELELYERNKPKWLKTHQDQFVVIKADDVLGFFPNFHTAYTAGVEKYGAGTDFLVKRILPRDPVFVVF